MNPQVSEQEFNDLTGTPTKKSHKKGIAAITAALLAIGGGVGYYFHHENELNKEALAAYNASTEEFNVAVEGYEATIQEVLQFSDDPKASNLTFKGCATQAADPKVCENLATTLGYELPANDFNPADKDRELVIKATNDLKTSTQSVTDQTAILSEASAKVLTSYIDKATDTMKEAWSTFDTTFQAGEQKLIDSESSVDDNSTRQALRDTLDAATQLKDAAYPKTSTLKGIQALTDVTASYQAETDKITAAMAAVDQTVTDTAARAAQAAAEAEAARVAAQQSYSKGTSRSTNYSGGGTSYNRSTGGGGNSYTPPAPTYNPPAPTNNSPKTWDNNWIDTSGMESLCGGPDQPRCVGS